ncbi:MAG: AI-2E family transporter [Bacteroidota bacterium]
MTQNRTDFLSKGMNYGKLSAFFLAFITLVGVVFVLQELMEVLLPLVFAMILSQLFKPLVSFLRVRRVPLAVCILLVLLIVGAFLGGISLIITGGIQNIVAQAPNYQGNFQQLVQSVDQLLTELSGKLGRHVAHIDLTESIQLSSVTSFLASGAGSFFSLLTNMFLMFLFLIFLLLGSEDFSTKVYSAFSTEDSYRLTQILAQINSGIRRYLVTKTLINVAVAGVTVVVLLLFGVDFPLFIGTLTFFLNYIPNLGPLIAVLLPVLSCILGGQSWGLVLSLLGVLIVLHSVIGNFFEPKLMGSSLDLSPLVVLLSLIFWGWVWGVWGMVLAIPITSMIKIVCEHIVPLQPIALLMGTVSHGEPEKEPR